MASRTISTSDDVEAAFNFLANEKKLAVDDFFMNQLSLVFSSLTSEANKKKYEQAKQIMTGNDQAKVIADLKKLLG